MHTSKYTYGYHEHSLLLTLRDITYDWEIQVFDLLCEEDNAHYSYIYFDKITQYQTVKFHAILLGQRQTHCSSCCFKHRMLCSPAVQSLSPFFGLYFPCSCLSWAALSRSSDEHIPEPFYHYDDYFSSLSWAAALPRYDELVVEQLVLLQ